MPSLSHRQAGKTHFLFILIAIVAIGSGVLVQTSKAPPPTSPEFKKAILLPTPKHLGDVAFTDHNGESFSKENLLNKWSILFFAFTNCPDICPTTMQTLSQVKKTVSDAGAWDNFQVAMVTVDPERDSSERLKNYVSYFDSEFIGLTAPVKYTTDFAKNVGILFFKGEVLENGGYDMEHGASLILVNPEGQYAGAITAPHKADEISRDLIKLAQLIGTSTTSVKASKNGSQAASRNENLSLREKTSDVSINDAWIRPAPPSVTSMAAYFDLTNNTEDSITIASVDSPEFENAMIHKTSINDGVASMDHMDALNVPAQSTVQLTPMGIHVMLVGAIKPLAKGAFATITLETTDGQEITKRVEVKQPPQ